MSLIRQRARDLVGAYRFCLEKQIMTHGSSLPCEDEGLCKEVEKLLKSENACDTHCLGLDTFEIMEESLRSAVATNSKGITKVRASLKGLAKAFEVLEQAALNLYLGPWREEYKVVKMYSGVFTHHIKPVFSMQQIEQLFALLGYKPCSAHREQLLLEPQQVITARLDELLHLACAFFVARCECCLLLAALGNYSGQAQTELNVVRERKRGHSLQVALDNTMRTAEVKQPLPALSEEGDMDLYTDEQVDGGPKEMLVDEPLQSLTWIPEKSAANSNGARRQQVYVSTHYSQLKSPSALDSKANGASSSSRYHSHVFESIGDKVEAQAGRLYEEKPELVNTEAESLQSCTCLQLKHVLLFNCTECQTYHHLNCSLFQPCFNAHRVKRVDKISEQVVQMGAAASQQRGNISPTLTNSIATFSGLALDDDSKPTSPVPSPMAHHDCCDLAVPNPEILCFTCRQFHRERCSNTRVCLKHHEAKLLGLCSGERCLERNILSLCRYCGNEYCKSCWFKSPLNCTCGQTLDMSSSV